MTGRLILAGLKGKLRSYALLLSGLVISAAIFTMFQQVANNKQLLDASGMGQTFQLSFWVGTILLSIITFIYLRYANSFMMGLRQREYAMLMMLGARPSRIRRLVVVETVGIGVVASLLGIAIGLGGTALLNQFLIKQLVIPLDNLPTVVPLGLIITIAFLIIIFIICAFTNAVKVSRSKLIDLLHEDATPVIDHRPLWRLVIQAVIGLGMMGGSFYLMCHIKTFQVAGLLAGVVLLLGGSYMVIHAVSITIIRFLERSPKFSRRGLNSFLLGQLDFRLRDYAKVLTIVSVLFGLALGAITVALGLRGEIADIVDTTTYYDVVLNNPKGDERAKVAALLPQDNVTYTLKETADHVYLNGAELEAKPIKGWAWLKQGEKQHSVQYKMSQINQDQRARQAVVNNLLPSQQAKQIQVVSADEFNQIAGKSSRLQLVKADNFARRIKQVLELDDINTHNNPEIAAVGADSMATNGVVAQTKGHVYRDMSNSLSALEYTGFFLGVAFLAMLVSCLMFKVLSGATTDARRYDIISKVGAHPNLLKRNVMKEVGLLFAIPAVLGIIDVLIGLQMFYMIIIDPYKDIWIPIAIFLVAYFLYYLATAKTYQSRTVKTEG